MGRVTDLATPAPVPDAGSERTLVSPGPMLPPAVFGAVDTARGWYVTLLVTAFAALTRFWNLSNPTDDGFYGGHPVQTPIFDEKHYAPQAWQAITSGRFIADDPGFGLIVHPPVGKWMIGIGEWLFGYTPLGWRFMAAVCGTLLIFMVVRTARRLSRSTLIGGLAGLLLVADGLTMVSSRVALLDIFLVFFGFAAFSMLIADRDQMRRRFQRAAAEGRIADSPYGPRLGFRWWRFSAGIMLGLACGVKWSGLYFLAGLVLMTLVFDYCNRRAYRVQRPLRGTLARDLFPGGISLGVLPILVYLGTFWAWFSSETAVYRYEVHNAIGADGPFGWIPAAWRSLFHYQATVLQFHAQLTNSNGNYHPWESKPWTWPMGLRPMLYAYRADESTGVCGDGPCVRAVMAIGTPALVWLAIPVVAWALWKTIVKRDWAYATATLMYFVTYLPWFLDLDRQMYYFYGLTLMPFYAIMLGLICRDLLAMRGRDGWFGFDRQTIGKTTVVIYVCVVLVNFAWLWPILTGSSIPMWLWNAEIWLPSWR